MSTASRIAAPALLVSGLLLFPLACPTDGDDDDSAPNGVEGDQPGECSDIIDNDQDGLFDCNDPDCATSPECTGDDDDATDDDDAADDDDAGDDDSAPDDDDSAPGDDDDATDDDDASNGCPAGAVIYGEVEDNNEPGEANAIALNGETAVCVTGQSLCGPLSKEEVYDDTDFFTLTLPTASLTVQADITWNDPSLDVDLFVFDGPAATIPPGSELNTPTDGPGQSETASAPLTGSDFTALVTCKSTAGALADYELILTW